MPALSCLTYFYFFRWLLISCWAEISFRCQSVWLMDWLKKADWMGTEIQDFPQTSRPDPSRLPVHYETLIKYTWKINWTRFDSGREKKENQPSAWRSPHAFQMFEASPLRSNGGRCINILYWLDQDPWQLYPEIPSGRCLNPITKNRTWQVINLPSFFF